MSTHWALRLIHTLYIVFVTIAAWVQRRTRSQPRPLEAHRSKLPKHLCLNLVANEDVPTEEIETAFLECLQSVAAWCRVLGIETLTVYDRHGVVHGCAENARRRVFLSSESSEDSCESEVEYPLTPPLSESSDSRCHSPERPLSPEDLNTITMMHLSRLQKRRNVAVRRRPKSKSVTPADSHLTLHIVSRASGKPGIASAGRWLLRSCVNDVSISDGTIPYSLTVPELAAVLEAAFPPPDLMVIHDISGTKTPQSPIEFHGFPPWQITLTEFHRTQPDHDHFEPSIAKSSATPVLLSETAFCRALDEYSGAQFRRGR